MRIRKVRKDAGHGYLDNSSYFNGRIGFWGTVKDVNSKINRVTVIADTGQELIGIPVMSKEWVNKSEDVDYVTGSRNLPPVGARVFVLMPTHSAAGAFVLCSGFAPGEKDTHTFYAADDTEKSKKDKVEEKVTQGGWNHKEYYSNGNLTIDSNDGNISIQIIQKDDTENSLTKGINIKAWNHEINITDEEIKIKSNKDISVDAGSNKISLDGSEIDLKGSSKSFVTYSELNTALTKFITALNLAMTTTEIIGNGSPQATWTGLPTSIDISAAQTKNIKTGG